VTELIVRRLVSRAPLIAFVTLAFAISWMIWSPLVVGSCTNARVPPSVLYYAGVLGPTIAAFICGAAGAPASPGSLVQRLLHWRVHPVWYVVAIVLPFAVRGLAIAATSTLQSAPGALLPRPAEAIARILVLMVLLVPFEEVGWRGYALPILQRKRSPLASSVILGGIWGLWHLPLAWACVGHQQSSNPWSYMLWFLATILPVSCLMTWLFNRTGESVFIASLFHIAINTADFGLVLPQSTGNSVLLGTSIISTLLVGILWRHDRLKPAVFETARLLHNEPAESTFEPKSD
jgi:uncharacterized protein